MPLIKPPKLENDDTIALISPSSGLAGLFPHRLDNAIKALGKMGFKTKEFPNTRKFHASSYGVAKEKAMELMAAFEDPSVSAVLCTIGGMTSNQLLKHIDFDVIKKNPKIFCGYSDISVLHYAIHKKSQLVTFYGPSAMNQFGEYPKPAEYTIEHFLKAVAANGPVGKIEPSKKWTEEFLDWSAKKDMKSARTLQTNSGYEWLGDGRAKGPIIGGCLPSIMHLRGTEYWPSHRDCLMFLEIPEGETPSTGMPLSHAEAYLTDLELSGVFEEINGLVFGRPLCYGEKDRAALKTILKQISRNHSIPILFGADIGHTDPMITIPIGVSAEINSKQNLFEIEEAGVL